MNQPTPSRRSERSNRRLPARYLDGALEVTQPCKQKGHLSAQREKYEGKKLVAANKPVKTGSPLKACSQSPKVVSKRIRKVKWKTDTVRKSPQDEPKNDSSAVETLSGQECDSEITVSCARIKQSPRVKCKTDAAWKTTRGQQSGHTLKTPKESLQCETCMHKFSSRRILRRHVQAASCQKREVKDSELEEEVEETDVQAEDGTPSKKTRKVCKICRKSFVDKYTLLVHRRTHTGERPYHCTLCDAKFTQRSALQFHLDTHAGQKHKCSICGYIFTQARSLKRHMLFHTGNKEMKRKLINRNYKKVRVPAASVTGVDGGDSKEERRLYVEVYECHYCKKQFKRVAELTVHLRVHTNERPFSCKTCGKSFKQLCHLHGHQATHERVVHICEDCGSAFSQAKSLKRHQTLKICTGENLDLHVGQRRKKGRPRKNECDPQSVDGYDDNQMTAFGDGTDEANEDTAYPAVENLGEGVEDENAENSENQEVGAAGTGNKFVCEQCGKAYAEKNNFVRHCSIHHSQRAFSCHVCHKTFRLSTYLKEHLKSHSQEKPFSCENCNKTFKRLRGLQNHVGRNSCSGIRPYTCDTCGKSFMYSRYLKTHRCHNTPVKLFSCGDCGKCYDRRDRLIEHMRSHTGERPFVCDTCGKTFAKIANFRLHQRVHTGEKRYECTHCGKRFAHNSTLKYHEGTHSANKPFPCDECDKQFPRSKALLTHKQVTHGACGAPQRTSYQCANCGKVYHHLKRLLRHYCEVNGGKRFQCGMCEKQFDREKQLEIHMRVHTGERPYECEQCGKRFSQSGGLKDHMLCHTREKKFQCDLCDVKFLRMKSLRKHKLIIHTGVEPHICKQCGATFKYYKALKKHELVHWSDQRTFTDILEDVEQVINETSNELEQQSDQAIVQVVSAVDPAHHVAEVVIQDNPACHEIIIGDDDARGQILHLIQDPQQLEIDQSIHEIQIQTQLEEEEERAQQVLMAVVASVDHHEEVVSAP